jgi:hypothetical protein
MSPTAEIAAASGYCVFLALAGAALALAGRRGAQTWPESDRLGMYRGLARVLWLLALFVFVVMVARHFG